MSSILVFFTISHASATELKGQPEELRRFLHPAENIVSLKGEGKETAFSDKAIVHLIITTEEDDLADALKKNSTLRQLVVSTLTSKGTKAGNINTSKFSTSPQFGWFGDSPDSYEIVNRMAINIFSETELQEIAKLSDAHKEIELSNTSYEHTEKENFLMSVKKKALENVMKQKAFYEKSLGVTLVTKNFRDSNIGYGATRGANELRQQVVITGSRIKRSKSSSKPAIMISDSSSSPQQSFDEVEYKATIFVDFVVNTKK